ncbi:MAG: signal transduction histidine kinase, partial [Planctomycetota bacterium]
MKKNDRIWWLVYWVASSAALFALALLSSAFLELESRSRGDAERGAAVRLALWRMDSWVSTQLAREAAREPQEYRSFTPLPSSTTGLRVSSPLLLGGTDFASFHFEIRAGDNWGSPQLPLGDERELALTRGWIDDEGVEIQSRLQQLQATLSTDTIRQRLASVQAELPILLNDSNVARSVQDGSKEVRLVQSSDQDASRSTQEFNLRNQNNYKTQWMTQKKNRKVSPNQLSLEEQPSEQAGSYFGAVQGEDRVTPLVAIWVENGERAQLCCVRESEVKGVRTYQGFVVDWEGVRTQLLDQVRDLFDNSKLERARPMPAFDATTNIQPDQAADRLATLPVRFDPGPAPPRVTSFGGADLSKHAASTLLVSWAFALAAVLAVGFALHRTIAQGHQRTRFATAVTHELRTPLTTFRMYSEMLAKDMVEGEDTRREYLETLESESRRLSRLVENVLSHARLEDQSVKRHRESTTVGELLNSCLPMLERHALESTALFEWNLPPKLRDTALTTDPGSVGQVLLNLIDNACKYGASDQGVEIQLDITSQSGRLRLALSDQGPGVPKPERSRIFKAFERGRRALAEGGRGVGLGLALS